MERLREPSRFIEPLYILLADVEPIKNKVNKNSAFNRAQICIYIAKVKSRVNKNGVPNGTRTRVAALKGRSPRPLDDGDAHRSSIIAKRNHILDENL